MASRTWVILLGDGSRCSAMVHTARQLLTTAHNCSATHHGGRTMSLTARLCSHLLGQAQDSVAQRVQGTQGLAVGVRPRIPTTDYMGCATRGGPAHKTKPCGAWRYSARPARHREDILKILRDMLGYVRPDITFRLSPGSNRPPNTCNII